ncbi:MAG: glycosyltransferase [Candidatus Aminicenantes bacterium]
MLFWVLVIFQGIIFAYFIFLNLIYTLFGLMSFREIKRNIHRVTAFDLEFVLASPYYRPISIIVPSYNEEETIVDTVNSLLALDYPQYEIVLVNDGSTDKTMEVLEKNFNLVRHPRPIKKDLSHEPVKDVFISLKHPILKVVGKENGKKYDALNTGINASLYPVICSVDADSILDSEGLLRAARQFVRDKEVVATGGIVRPLNPKDVEGHRVVQTTTPKNLVEMFQAVEYVRSFLAGRTSWNYFKSLLIISGTFSLIRKDILIAAGGYRGTIGEDMDIIVRIHRHALENNIPYKILFMPDPICHTKIPSKLKGLLKQRNRWHRGLIDSLMHNRKMLFNPKYGSVGMIGFPYFLFIEAGGPLVEFIGYVGFIIFWATGMLHWTYALFFFILAFLWGIWINLASIFLDNILYKRYKKIKDILKLFLFAFLENLGFRQLLTFERLRATFMYRKKNW